MTSTDAIEIKEVTTFSPEIAERIRHLVSLLGSEYQLLSDSDLQSLIASETTRVIVAIDSLTGAIVGMITLVTYRIPYKMKGWMEDLVVEEAYRGKGIATQLIEKTIALARLRGVKVLDFTSQPKRESANKLYERLGFIKRETNVYRLVL